MKIAILADIHGNSVALDATLKDLAQQGRVDQTIFLGDFFAPGVAIRTILQLVQQVPNAHFLRGNADRYLVDHSFATVYGLEGWQGNLRRAFQWTEEHLHSPELKFLASLPFSYAIPLGNRRLLAVHGSPSSDEEGLTAATTAADLRRMSLDPDVAVLVCGHTHIPLDRRLEGVRLVNVGSVGIPFDGDARACYALISYSPSAQAACFEPEAVQVELRRVPYNVERAVEQLYAIDHPAAEMNAYNLRAGRPLGTMAAYEARLPVNNSTLLDF